MQGVLESLAHARYDNLAVRVTLARWLAGTGNFEAAAVRAQEVAAAAPKNPQGIELLASVFSDAGDVDRVRPLVARTQQANPDREETWYYAAAVSFSDGNLREAIARARRVIEINASRAPAYDLIAAASAMLGRRDRARQAFRASLEADPRGRR